MKERRDHYLPHIDATRAAKPYITRRDFQALPPVPNKRTDAFKQAHVDVEVEEDIVPYDEWKARDGNGDKEPEDDGGWTEMMDQGGGVEEKMVIFKIGVKRRRVQRRGLVHTACVDDGSIEMGDLL